MALSFWRAPWAARPARRRLTAIRLLWEAERRSSLAAKTTTPFSAGARAATREGPRRPGIPNPGPRTFLPRSRPAGKPRELEAGPPGASQRLCRLGRRPGPAGVPAQRAGLPSTLGAKATKHRWPWRHGPVPLTKRVGTPDANGTLGREHSATGPRRPLPGRVSPAGGGGAGAWWPLPCWGTFRRPVRVPALPRPPLRVRHGASRSGNPRRRFP